MAVSIPLSPESLPSLLRRHPSLSHPLFLPLFLPSPPLLFLFHSACTSSSYFLFLLPSLSLSLPHTPSRFCIRVPIAVESLSGLAERRFRRHDNEPRKPSHSLTPFLPSSLSLPLSTSPRLHRFSPPCIHHHNQRPPPPILVSTCFHASVSAYLCFCVSIPYVLYAPLHRLPNARTTTPPPPPVLRAPARSGSADCRPGSSTSSTSCSQAAAPPPNRGVWRRVAGARNPAPRRVECACSRNETYGVYPLLAPLPDGNIERIAPRLIGVGKKERKKGKEEEEKER